MSDVVISYDSTNREKALETRQFLEDHGLSVWMDNARASDSDTSIQTIGIAVGAFHQDEILQEILAASVVLILDSARWRTQDYCRWEYNTAKNAGKRIAVLADDLTLSGEAPESTWPVADLDEFVARFPSGLTQVEAHARLLSITNNGNQTQGRPPVEAKMLSRDPAMVEDARAVLANATAPAEGISISQPVSDLAASIVKADSTRSKNRRVGFIAAGLAVVLMAVAAVGMWATSAASLSRAESDMAVQQSLSLAQQAMSVGDTYQAMGLATEAVRSARTPQALAAYSSAWIASQQHQSFSIPASNYLAAMMTPDGTKLVVVDQQTVWVADLTTGVTVRNVPLDVKLGSRIMGITPDGDHVAAVTTDGQLVQIDMKDGWTEQIPVVDGASFCVDDKGVLWVADKSGVVTQRNLPWTHSQPSTVLQTGISSTAINIASDGESIFVLGGDGSLTSFDLGTGTIVRSLSAYSSAWQPSTPLGGKASPNADVLTSCQDAVIVIRGSNVRVAQSDGSFIGNMPDMMAGTIYGTARMTAACLGARGAAAAMRGLGASGASNFTNEPGDPISQYLGTPSRAADYQLIGNDSGEQIVLLNDTGQVDVLHVDKTSVNYGSTSGVIPISDGDGQPMTVNLGGALFDLSGQQIGDLGMKLAYQDPVITEDAAYVAGASSTLVRIDLGEGHAVSSCTVPGLNADDNFGMRSTGAHYKPAIMATHAIGQVESTDPFTDGLCGFPMIAIPALGADESIQAVAINNDSTLAAIATNDNRLMLLNWPSGDVVVESTVDASSEPPSLMFNDDGRLIAATTNGNITLLDERLNPVTARIQQYGAQTITPLYGTQRAVLRLTTGALDIIDTSTLLTIQRVPATFDFSGQLFAYDSSAQAVWIVKMSVDSDSDLSPEALIDSMEEMGIDPDDVTSGAFTPEELADSTQGNAVDNEDTVTITRTLVKDPLFLDIDIPGTFPPVPVPSEQESLSTTPPASTNSGTTSANTGTSWAGGGVETWHISGNELANTQSETHVTPISNSVWVTSHIAGDVTQQWSGIDTQSGQKLWDRSMIGACGTVASNAGEMPCLAVGNKGSTGSLSLFMIDLATGQTANETMSEGWGWPAPMLAVGIELFGEDLLVMGYGVLPGDVPGMASGDVWAARIGPDGTAKWSKSFDQLGGLGIPAYPSRILHGIWYINQQVIDVETGKSLRGSNGYPSCPAGLASDTVMINVAMSGGCEGQSSSSFTYPDGTPGVAVDVNDLVIQNGNLIRVVDSQLPPFIMVQRTDSEQCSAGGSAPVQAFGPVSGAGDLWVEAVDMRLNTKMCQDVLAQTIATYRDGLVALFDAGGGVALVDSNTGAVQWRADLGIEFQTTWRDIEFLSDGSVLITTAGSANDQSAILARADGQRVWYAQGRAVAAADGLEVALSDRNGGISRIIPV